MARRSELPGVLFLFAAVAVLALLFGWWLGPRLRPAPIAEHPKAEPPELRIEELSFDDLAELLEAEGRDPAALAFARDFAAKPRLRRLYTGFLERAAHSRARQEKGPPARDFVRELKAMREFSELFAKWSKDAAFRSMAERLARKPGMAPMLRQGAGGAAAASAADAEGKAGRVFGLYGVDTERQDDPAAQQASVSDAGSGPAAPATGRVSSDPRIEGHWVHDGAAVDPLAICAKLGSTGPCQQAILDCRRDPSCARKLGGYGGGHGGVAASTRSRRADDGGQGAMRLGEPAPK